MLEALTIVGPTAAGKSGLAMRIAPDLGGEIINADALQVYRGLDIGTAKASVADRERIGHHMLDVADPEERFSAGAFARMARAVIEALTSAGKLPILVGGSGLYLKALLEGITEIPEVPDRVRRRLLGRLETEGLRALRTDLQRLDTATAARLAPGDTQRVLRALEVVIGTGRPLSEWIAEKPPRKQEIQARKIGLTLSRGLLYDRIRARVESMLEGGWLHEVESLLNRGYSGEEPAFQAIGYRQLVRHLRGESSLEEAVDETVRSTRRYAKRQLTWFRADAGIAWFDASDADALESEVRSWLVK
ncbi:MAG: tRNA (adenosine(37)-N6)-dimethylallyltransferase MiaA [Thermoanaerobaculia bacterium]